MKRERHESTAHGVVGSRNFIDGEDGSKAPRVNLHSLNLKDVLIVSGMCVELCSFTFIYQYILRVCIQKFPDRPPGVRTANGTDFCH
jgi:hypothetical protein